VIESESGREGEEKKGKKRWRERKNVVDSYNSFL
jgi:hypothetical protein